MAFKVVGVGVTNAAEFKAKLAAMAKEARTEVVEAAALNGAEEFVAAAQANAPLLKADDPRRVRGNLRMKIKKFLLKKKDGSVTVGVGIDKKGMRDKLLGAFYALWVEYGTRFMAPIPYLRPAFDAKHQAAGRRAIGTFEAWLGGHAE